MVEAMLMAIDSELLVRVCYRRVVRLTGVEMGLSRAWWERDPKYRFVRRGTTARHSAPLSTR
jgi:hypothetical protein